VPRFFVFAGLERDWTESETEIYFTDANGDGLPDIVSGGKILFNHIDANGNPTFRPQALTVHRLWKPEKIRTRIL
jgi:hypothetical protein